jgi:hypothetical protein
MKHDRSFRTSGDKRMALKRVGFFREVRAVLREDTSALPSIHEAIRDVAHPDEGRIVEYLREGCGLAWCGGVFPDVLNPHSGVMLSPDYLTDGVWLWPGELRHYVAEHHVALPDEFVDDMRENGWVVPALSQALCNALLRETYPRTESTDSRKSDSEA